MMNKKIIFGFSAAALIILLGGLVAVLNIKPRVEKKEFTPPQTIQRTEVNALVFYDWWTSPSEVTAVNALIELFKSKYPDTVVTPTPVIGGAGYAMMSIVKPLVASGQPPDAFQMHAGYEGMPYYRAGLLESVDDIWESEGLKTVIPSVVQEISKFDGHYYSVPVDIHRVNLIWYNKDIIFKNNIDVSKIKTWDDFFSACDELKASGVKYPAQIGEPWTAAQVFEQMVAGEGVDFYQDWVNGKVTSAKDARLLRVLETFKKYLSYTNPDYEKLTWDKVVDRLANGDAAFVVMGDWADREMGLSGKKFGTDYGAIVTPGTDGVYGLSIDSFQRPKGILHPTNASRWLRLIVSQEGQDTFNSLKGSIPVRTDVDVSKYDDYQRSAISDFWKARSMFPSVVHGSGAPQSFKLKLTDIVADFIVDRNVDKAAADMTTYSAIINDEYTINWSLK